MRSNIQKANTIPEFLENNFGSNASEKELNIGFKYEQPTTGQVHRIIIVIEQAYEEDKTCTALLIDVAKAFDKVRHEGKNLEIKLSAAYAVCSAFAIIFGEQSISC